MICNKEQDLNCHIKFLNDRYLDALYEQYISFSDEDY